MDTINNIDLEFIVKYKDIEEELIEKLKQRYIFKRIKIKGASIKMDDDLKEEFITKIKELKRKYSQFIVLY
jgi:hypothetical protein